MSKSWYSKEGVICTCTTRKKRTSHQLNDYIFFQPRNRLMWGAVKWKNDSHKNRTVLYRVSIWLKTRPKYRSQARYQQCTPTELRISGSMQKTTFAGWMEQKSHSLRVICANYVEMAGSNTQARVNTLPDKRILLVDRHTSYHSGLSCFPNM